MDSKENRGQRPPPTLPPRQSNDAGPSGVAAEQEDPPPPYELVAHQQRAFEKATKGNPSASGYPLGHNDPRSSSQQSLVPEPGEQDQRRKLLLIYIHGFMGNETSFRSFPAHLHNLLAVLLAETHVIHTKIYPRYRSKGHISHARDDFSKWLEPHESSTTDVVLLGHSMGGLLSAEIVLMPPTRPASRPLNHRILGTINFDVPFLGMHPGVVKSGLSSIFKPSEETHQDKWEAISQEGKENYIQSQEPVSSQSSRTDTFWDHSDPNFNPKFNNDVVLPVRKGWKSAWHFVNKHSGDLLESTKKLISSHMEFGGAMANYGELKIRYSKIRALEEEDGRIRQSVVEGGIPPRVHFVNYYTASTGRPKPPKSPHPESSSHAHGSQASSQASRPSSQQREGIEQDEAGGSSTPLQLLSPLSTGQQGDQQAVNTSNEVGADVVDSSHGKRAGRSSSTDVLQRPPPLGDLSYIQDPSIRKLVEDEHRKAVEKYESSIRKPEAKQEDKPKPKEQREPNPPPENPQRKLTHSEKEALRLEGERKRMEAEARRLRGEKEPQKEEEGEESVQARPSIESIPRIASSSASPPPSMDETLSVDDETYLAPTKSKENASEKPKKDRKFCTLPPKDSNGERDPCWVRVFMKDVDEVGAHCGLFFVDERYEQLVGDVAERIERWVNEDMGQRFSKTEKS